MGRNKYIYIYIFKNKKGGIASQYFLNGSKEKGVRV